MWWLLKVSHDYRLYWMHTDFICAVHTFTNWSRLSPNSCSSTSPYTVSTRESVASVTAVGGRGRPISLHGECNLTILRWNQGRTHNICKNLCNFVGKSIVNFLTRAYWCRSTPHSTDTGSVSYTHSSVTTTQEIFNIAWIGGHSFDIERTCRVGTVADPSVSYRAQRSTRDGIASWGWSTPHSVCTGAISATSSCHVSAQSIASVTGVGSHGTKGKCIRIGNNSIDKQWKTRTHDSCDVVQIVVG